MKVLTHNSRAARLVNACDSGTVVKNRVRALLTLLSLVSWIILPCYASSRPAPSASAVSESRSVGPRYSVSESDSIQTTSDSPRPVNVWTSNGPEGGEVYSLAIDPVNPSIIYAGNSQGVFKSTDGGRSWGSSNTAPIFDSKLIIDPSNTATIYAASEGTVLKSTDGGASWSNQDIVTLWVAWVYDLAIDPRSTSTIYAATSRGVFKSTNGGASWTGVLTDFQPSRLAIDPVNTAIVYAAGFHGVFKTTDGGVAWTKVGKGLLEDYYLQAIAIDPSNSNTIYAGTYQGVLKSTDSGAKWTKFENGLPKAYVQTLAIDALHTATIYAATGSGLFKSTNGGTSWSLSSSLPTFDIAIDPSNPGSLFIGTDVGIFKSPNDGTMWSRADRSGLGSAVVNSLVIDPRDPATVYATSPGGLFKSTSGGASWNSTGLSLAPVRSLAIDPNNSNIIYAASFVGDDGTVFKSTDGGANWSESIDGLKNVEEVVIDPLDSKTLYVGAYDGVFKSTNGGASWTRISTLHAANPLVIDPVNSSIIYAASLVFDYFEGFYYSILFKSIDGGASWSQLPITIDGRIALAIDPSNPNTVYAGSYRSINGGVSWTSSSVYGYVVALAIDPVHPKTIYAGTGSGVFKSTDEGTSWGEFNGGMTKPNVNALVIDSTGTFLHAGTNAGIFHYEYGAGCADSISPTTQSSDPYRLAGTVNVTAGDECAWTGISNANWIKITEGSTGSGNGAVNYSVAGNISMSPRITTLVISGRSFTVTQAGLALLIFNAYVSGKQLVVRGENFEIGAVILLNGLEQKTRNEDRDPKSILTGKRAGKTIKPGDKLQVRNPNGALSQEFTFTG